jgi:hypothetical protein
MTEFVLPGGTDRTTVIGMTGSGKTVFGAWLLSRQRFDLRPWLWLDFKNEELIDQIGRPAMQTLRLGDLPDRRGLYRVSITPGDDELLEQWLWKIWRRENIGIFCDECSLIPKGQAFKAILRQGRSKRIPVIACTQRPVDCDREVFTESNYLAVFRVKDRRDARIIEDFSGTLELGEPLPDYWSHWFDARRNTVIVLKPAPPPDKVAASLREAAPVRPWFAF